jgi:rod shape determining protein RodA
MFTFHIFQNMGMNIGLTPITGVPLPFMSYGGSSLLTNIISIALIVNVGMRKNKIDF